MKERFVKLAEAAFSEKLSKEDFLKEFDSNPDLFCALRISELSDYSEQIVRECLKFTDRPTDLLAHFGFKD